MTSSRKRRAGGLAEDEVAHRLLQPGERLELRVPVRVGQEAHVEDEIGLERDAVLEPERHDVDPQLLGDRCARHDGEEPVLELADREAARVDHVVGELTRARQPAPLLRDAGLDAAARGLERVPVAGLAEPADKAGIARLEVDELELRSPRQRAPRPHARWPGPGRLPGCRGRAPSAESDPAPRDAGRGSRSSRAGGRLSTQE